MGKEIRIVFLFVLSLFAIGLSAQRISNVKASQEGKRVIITYDIISSESGAVNIQLFYRNNGGSWNEARSGLSGDVGRNVSIGTYKTITWDPISDGKQLSGTGYEFKVVADLAPLELLREQRAERERVAKQREREMVRRNNRRVHDPEYGGDVAGSFLLFTLSGAAIGVMTWTAMNASHQVSDSSYNDPNNPNTLADNKPTAKSRIFITNTSCSVVAGVTFAVAFGFAIDLAIKASDAVGTRGRAAIDFKDKKGNRLASATIKPVIAPNFANNRWAYSVNFGLNF